MNFSRISRGLMVAMFVITIVFLGVLDVKLIFENQSSMYSALTKIVYIAIIFSLTLLYVYIKEKLYKMKIKRNVSFIYRYIYLIMVIVISKYIIISRSITNASVIQLLLMMIITVVASLIVKRIVFNISKSDILSVVTMVGYTMILNVIKEPKVFIFSCTIQLIVLAIILLLQLLIDELKQKGIKTKKYIKFSILIGILMGISVILGVNILVWVLVSIILLFITMDLDHTHMNFPRRIISLLSQSNKDRLYKIERININKILISIAIALFIMFSIAIIGHFVLYKSQSYVWMQQLKIIMNQNCNINNANLNINGVIEYSKTYLGLSKTYYICLIAYILILEILSFFLRRRYDTKTTTIKTIFIAIYFAISIFNLNIFYFQPLLNILLVIIAIINTSSIYLNREERIKMLVA